MPLEEAFAAAIGGVRLWEDQKAELLLRSHDGGNDVPSGLATRR
jgi:hypothetical protein